MFTSIRSSIAILIERHAPIARTGACIFLLLNSVVPAVAAPHSNVVPPGGARGARVPQLPVLYVSDARTGAIGVFRLDSGREIASITYPMAPRGIRFSAGAGLATDAADNLYAAYGFDNGTDYPGKTVIFAYAPGEIHWFTKIDGGCCATPNIAISKRGEIAEAQLFFPPYAGGDVAFIEPGKRYVGRYNYSLAGANYAVYDANDTLWVYGVDEEFEPHLGTIRDRSNSFTEVALHPKPRLGPLAVDSANHVLVDNGSDLRAYDVRGSLVYRVTLSGASNVTSIALSHDGGTVYVAQKNGVVAAYRFPAGGLPIATYRVGGEPFAITLGAV
ncbi:MAG: hypothetical protein IAI50_12820 [Candidatus Eremiobacteraeota bacterium]|nr:hypothetical protein [Candidatus Eremiobacteraeota bacterium]